MQKINKCEGCPFIVQKISCRSLVGCEVTNINNIPVKQCAEICHKNTALFLFFYLFLRTEKD